MFFFNDTATTEIYTLSLHDALPILIIVDRALERREAEGRPIRVALVGAGFMGRGVANQIINSTIGMRRSEEHTSELQSRQYLVCRLLLEKKKIKATSVADGMHNEM